MRDLVYHVATSIDGFIAHADGGIDGFLMEGPHGDDYLAALREDYDDVVMGRRTYEWGYRYGATPGEPAYGPFGLANHIVSTSLPFTSREGFEIVRADPAGHVRALKQRDGKAIYLCGGGDLAGILLDAGLIDRVVLKVNPFVMGTGVPVFGGGDRAVPMAAVSVRSYDNGVLLTTYAVTR